MLFGLLLTYEIVTDRVYLNPDYGLFGIDAMAVDCSVKHESSQTKVLIGIENV